MSGTATKSPFYKISVRRSGRDLTEYVDNLTYEDCTDEDDVLKLTLRNKTIALLDDPDLLPGVELVFIFGFLGEGTSPRRICKISTVEPSYGKTIDVSLTATDAGYTMKKDTANTIWKNVRASEIVERIAKKNGLTARVTRTEKVYDNLPQGNKTDWEFLQYLTTIETDGSYRFFVKDNSLFFEPLNLSKPAARTFVYGGPDGNIISFRPRINQNLKTKGAIKTTAVSMDPYTGALNQSTADNATVKNDTKLGGNLLVFDAGSKLVDSAARRVIPSATTQTGNGQVLHAGPASQSDLDNLTNHEKKAGSLSDITATLEVPADPSFVADVVITIKGVAALHGGNWYVSKVTHSLTKAGYKMTMDLKKNAVNKKTGEVATGTVNKSVGPDGKQPITKTVYRYDANSQLKP